MSKFFWPLGLFVRPDAGETRMAQTVTSGSTAERSAHALRRAAGIPDALAPAFHKAEKPSPPVAANPPPAFFPPRLQLHRRAVGEVPDALQVGDELQTGQQLARFRFSHARNRLGQLIVDLALDLVELFLAILDRKKSQPRTVGEKIAHIKDRVAAIRQPRTTQSDSSSSAKSRDYREPAPRVDEPPSLAAASKRNGVSRAELKSVLWPSDLAYQRMLRL